MLFLFFYLFIYFYFFFFFFFFVTKLADFGRFYQSVDIKMPKSPLIKKQRPMLWVFIFSVRT